MVAIQWLGHPAFRIETAEGVVIYIDPWLDANPVCPQAASEVTEADIVCVTHGHRDHLGDTLTLIRQTGAQLVASPEIAFWAERHGIGYNDGSTPVNIGGAVKVRGITFHATHSVHTNATYGPEWGESKEIVPGGTAMGFVLELPGGIRLYHAGDTGLTADLKLIGEIYRPHVAMLPIGGRYVMTPELAARAAAWIGAPRVIPTHFNTASFNQQDPQRYQELVNHLTRGVDVVQLEPGDTYTFSIQIEEGVRKYSDA